MITPLPLREVPGKTSGGSFNPESGKIPANFVREARFTDGTIIFVPFLTESEL